MSPALPDGAPWPADGALDPRLVEEDAGRPLSLYVHVPFCRVRCGYCDFNTYTAQFGAGADLDTYAGSVLAEASLATRVLDGAGIGPRPASTVFFGGGTPTMLAPGELARALDGLRERIGIAPGAEVTLEANPDTVSARALAGLADAGFTRVSFGMQSAVPRVLATLDRTHAPERVPEAVAWAREAGLDVSVDLIYGCPGETLDDWRASLLAATRMRPDHISAYALVVEEGTRMGAQVARGELPAPDPDDEAAKYEEADAVLSAAGYRWYEISNFALVGPDEAGALDRGALAPTALARASRHNLAYWRDWDWWGLGPGAHSHIGALRWWNVKHPAAYASRLARGLSPAHSGEALDAPTRDLERVMLAVRTGGGVALADLEEKNVAAVRAGAVNLRRHCENLTKVFAQRVLVAVNRFAADAEAEIAAVRESVADLGIDVVLTDHFGRGGEGALDFADAVVKSLAKPSIAKSAYSLADSLEDKARAVVTRVYRGADVVFEPAAARELRRLEESGWGELPVCMAKTQYSFSTDPKALGAPEGFTVPIREVRLSAGAGFVVLISGSIMTMPGLPKRPSACDIDVVDGVIEGMH